MLLSTSILSVKDNIKNSINDLENTNIDYIHLDIMDGEFVSNCTRSFEEDYELFKDVKKPLDVHLMVNNIKNYVDNYKKLNPTYITFHYEATKNPYEMIKYIKDYKIKVGISISPKTNISVLEPYLDMIDLILIMSVEPGIGGQQFIESSTDKVKRLKELKDKYHYSYQIEVDGGINNNTIKNIADADIAVVGSYITNSDNYEEQIKTLL